jgi:hypothetical protein
MHTECWRTYSSHVRGYSAARAAHSFANGRYSLSCGWRRAQTVPTLAVLQRSIHNSWAWIAAVSLRSGPAHVRSIAWSPHAHPRPADPRGLSDEQEDEAKAAILEKVMKGRQPTDLMLRCELILLICTSLAQ